MAINIEQLRSSKTTE